MKNQSVTLTNKSNGNKVCTIKGNIVRTKYGTYEVEAADVQWLINEASNRKDFCWQDVKAVGFMLM